MDDLGENEMNRIDNIIMKLFLVVALIWLLLIMCIPTIHAASVNISWNATPDQDVSGYEIYYGNATGTYGAPVIINGAGVTSYVLALPTPMVGENLFVALKAFDLSGNKSPYSAEASCYLPDMTAPSAPKNIVIVITAGQ
jgi:hypothetical protein